MSKYNARGVDADGIHFDSRAEYRRYLDLQLMERAGEITGLTVHPEYELQPHFRYNGKTERAIKYTPDFEYINSNGLKVCEEVKGCITKDYVLRKKLFLYRFPDIVFFENMV